MSKTLKYEQLRRNRYEPELLALPEDAGLFLSPEDPHEPSFYPHIVVCSKSRIEHDLALQMGDRWYLFLNNVRLTDTEVDASKLAECPVPSHCYIVRRRIADRYTPMERMEVASVARVTGFGIGGIETLMVKTDCRRRGEPTVEVAVEYLDYFTAWQLVPATTEDEYLVSTGDSHRRLFDEWLRRSLCLIDRRAMG